jgi:hypothetical protein
MFVGKLRMSKKCSVYRIQSGKILRIIGGADRAIACFNLAPAIRGHLQLTLLAIWKDTCYRG